MVGAWLSDLLDLVELFILFGRLEKVEVGGTKGRELTGDVQAVHEEFLAAYDAFKAVARPSLPPGVMGDGAGVCGLLRCQRSYVALYGRTHTHTCAMFYPGCLCGHQSSITIFLSCDETNEMALFFSTFFKFDVSMFNDYVYRRRRC